MRLRETLLACALVTALACGDATAVIPAVDQDAAGSWGQDNHGSVIAGNSFVMALNDSSGAITGVGGYAGEAGPYGGLKIAGTVLQDSLRLQIVFTPEPTVFPSLRPDTAQFVGRLADKNHIAGQLTRGGSAAGSFDLVRLMISDPP